MNKNILKGIIVVLFIIGFGLCICCFLVESNDKKEIPTSNVFKDEKIELSSEFYNYKFENDYKGTDIGNYEGISISDGMWPGYNPSDDRTMEQYDKDIKKAIELKAELINKLIKEKKSFIVTVQNASVCTANSYSLDLNTTKFCNDNNIYRFLMGTDVFFKTDLHKTVKYAPTTIIVKEGEVYKYTDPNSDEYIDFDKDYEKVKEWLEKYIVIK